MDRLKGKKEKPEPVRVAVVGEGPEAERLAAALHTSDGVTLTAAEVAFYGDGVIRQPKIKTPGLDKLDDVVSAPGLEAIEIVAPVEKRAEIARACIQAGLFTSIDPPANASELGELEELARSYSVPLRIRLLPRYYPPYREIKRMVSEDTLGRPLILKMTTRRGKGTELPDDLDPGKWFQEMELGFLSLAQWLVGPVEKVFARLNRNGSSGRPGSSVITWKYRDVHQYGYLQLDFCPGLHVRTFTEPVHRFIELTCLGGLIMATRGEGQMLRMPALIVRGKSTMSSFEMVPDDWNEVYKNLARETVKVLRKSAKPEGSVKAAAEAFAIVSAAKKSEEQGDEVPLVKAT